MGSACTPHDFDVEVIDVLDFGRIVFDGNKAASLFTGATRPIYDLTWRFSLTGRLLWGGGTAWNRIMYPAFTDYVREKRPAAIVCTHITAANVATAARMLTGQRFPIVCVPTDYETEGLWPIVRQICSASQTNPWRKRCARGVFPRSASSSPASPPETISGAATTSEPRARK